MLDIFYRLIVDLLNATIRKHGKISIEVYIFIPVLVGVISMFFLIIVAVVLLYVEKMFNIQLIGVVDILVNKYVHLLSIIFSAIITYFLVFRNSRYTKLISKYSIPLKSSCCTGYWILDILVIEVIIFIILVFTPIVLSFY